MGQGLGEVARKAKEAREAKAAEAAGLTGLKNATVAPADDPDGTKSPLYMLGPKTAAQEAEDAASRLAKARRLSKEQARHAGSKKSQ